MDDVSVKYEILLNAIFQAARLNNYSGNLYTVNDESIYTVVKALEPEKYAKCVKELDV